MALQGPKSDPSEEGEEDLAGVGVFFYPSPPRRERDREGRHIILSRPHRIQNLPPHPWVPPGEQGGEDRVRSSPTPSPFLRTSATGEGDKHVSGHQLLVLRLPAP